MKIDLNADLGEGFGKWKMGDDDAMLKVVSSANIACGGHAGDNTTMNETILSALKSGVVVGAHPGFEDRQGFGRRRLPLSVREVERLVAAQVGALAGIAALAGTSVAYVKPHGALGNWAAEDKDVAYGIVRAVRAVMPETPRILAISGSALESAAEAKSIEVFSEVFVDRGYTSQGGLIPRNQPGALIHDVDAAADRVIHLIETGKMPVCDGSEVALKVDSVCVHGDNEGAVAMARAARSRLEQIGVAIAPFCESSTE